MNVEISITVVEERMKRLESEILVLMSEIEAKNVLIAELEKKVEGEEKDAKN